MKNNKALKQKNRTDALSPFPIRKKEGLERQEYPYAATYEGGKGAFVTYVPEGEQRIEGGQITQLSKRLNDKDAFLVLPVPKDKELEPEPDPISVPVPNRMRHIDPSIHINPPSQQQIRTTVIGAGVLILLAILLSPVGV
ncbi:NucA/NucB deoxyribonuclease domain-containing protein [Flavobacterium sp.]|uniref:NucA/NucB deoxyribonuclease domain-containing protein n=1 Tax=Flavobacterium sp. TaxID=239 RepID=UPI004034DD05